MIQKEAPPDQPQERGRWLVWGWLGLLLVGVMPARDAHSAACCMSATSVGIGRLMIWEKFALGLRTTVFGGLGRWDTKQQWLPYGDGYKELEWRSAFWGIVRLSRKASLFGRLPWVLNVKEAGTHKGWGGGFADTQLGLRYELLSIGELLHVPAIALTFAINAPLGTPTHKASTPLGTEVTGRGAWVLSAGMVLEKTMMPWYVRLSLGVQVPLPMWREGLEVYQRFGVLVESALVGGVEIVEGLVLSLILRLGWEDDIRHNEENLPNTGRLDIGAALTLAWQFHAHWSVVIGVDTGVFVSGFGDNLPGRLSGNVGLRYGFF